MPILALLIFLSLIAIYITIAAAILYHIKKFEIDPRTATRAAIIFIGVSLFLLIAAGIIFLNIPWNDILPEVMPFFPRLPHAF